MFIFGWEEQSVFWIMNCIVFSVVVVLFYFSILHFDYYGEGAMEAYLGILFCFIFILSYFIHFRPIFLY